MTNQNHVASETEMLKTMRILAGAMGAFVLILGVVLQVLGKFVFDKALFNSLAQNPIFVILLVMGVGVLGLRIPLTNMIFKGALKKIDINDNKQLLTVYFVPFILRLALAEAGATIGFVSSFMFSEATSYVILAASALFAITREFPDLKRIQQRAQMLTSGRIGRSR